MSLRHTKWIAAICLCLYAAAFLHQLAPHHDADHVADCGLCLLVFATALIAAAVLLPLYIRPLFACARPATFCYDLLPCRSLRLRGPPSMLFR